MLFLPLVLLLFSFLDPVFGCPPGSVVGLNPTTCYSVVPFNYAFDEAEAFCNARGGHLASIASAYENGFIETSVLHCWRGGWLFIGGHRQDDTWRWTDGREFKYTNWDAGQPQGGLDCLAINHPQATWKSVSCGETPWFICKIERESANQLRGQPQSMALTLTDIQAREAFCDVGWSYFSRTHSCYKTFHTFLTFLEAEQICVSHGGHLASIHDKQENDFVIDISATGDVLDAWRKVPWLGISTIEQGFVFQWTDGTPVDYTDFHPSLNITSAQKCGLLVQTSLPPVGPTTDICCSNGGPVTTPIPKRPRIDADRFLHSHVTYSSTV